MDEKQMRLECLKLAAAIFPPHEVVEKAEELWGFICLTPSPERMGFEERKRKTLEALDKAAREGYAEYTV